MLSRIAVHLSHDQGCQRRLSAAIWLASHHKSEIIGVYPSDLMPQQGYDDTVIPIELQQVIRNQAARSRTETKVMFTEQTAAAGVMAQWRAPKGNADEVLALHARYCDLLIMSKAENRDTVTAIIPNLPESVVMAAGRPVIMIPTVGQITTIGQRILFCWDQKRESARAFADAAPLLRKCESLVVLSVGLSSSTLHNQDIPDNDFSNYCIAMGYPRPTIERKDSEDYGVGNMILNTATDYASDLIVMGAYGHSRMRQWIMGGASRTLFSSMTVPVLLSH
ncbi:MAG: universal stress protein [Burkholderiaceae bacterium]|nr:universal stress protein [Burkholderiaceae bacterium]